MEPTTTTIRPDHGSNRAPPLGLRFTDETFFEFAIFFIPILGVFKLRFLGEILFSDLIIPFLMIAALAVKGLPSSRLAQFTIGGALLWFTCLILSDIVNQTAAHEYLRGWARNGLACCYLIFFLCTVKPTLRSLTILGLGRSISILLFAFMYYSYSFEAFVKFGAGASILAALCVGAMWCWRAGRPILPVFGIFLCMALALSQNVRSNMTFNFAMIVLMLAAYYGHAYLKRMSIPLLLSLLVAIGGTLSFGMASTYSYLASSGSLGKNAQTKYKIQARGSIAEMVWNARPELRVAIAVITNSPILGHGSWYRDERIAAAELLFSAFSSEELYEGATARAVILHGGGEAIGHSSILQAWVESGIVGALFWLWVFVACVWVLLRSLQYPTVLSPYVMLSAVSLAWDVLFSPFASTQRFGNMLQLAIIVIVLVDTARRHRAVSSDHRTALPAQSPVLSP
jgi:hypothetical protein